MNPRARRPVSALATDAALTVFLSTYAAEDPGSRDHVFDVARGGDGEARSALAPLPLLRGPDRSVDPGVSMDRAPSLVQAGVTDLLVHARVPQSFEGARDVYSDLVAGRATSTR